MKISNNALNFLLAQYRAIFKRAYVKGIASAVLLTAGLAAGQAQATDAISGGAASWDEITTENSFTIANGASGSTPDKGQEYFYNITVQSGGTFDNSGSATQLVVTGTFTNEVAANVSILGQKLWETMPGSYPVEDLPGAEFTLQQSLGTDPPRDIAWLRIDSWNLQLKSS